MPEGAVRTWGVTFATNALIVLCGTATGILSARLLLPAGRGVLAAILFWPQLLASIGILSLNEAVTYRAAQPGADSRRLLTTALILALLLAGSTALIGYFALPWLLGAERAEWLPLARQYYIAFIPFNFVALSLLAMDHGAQRFVRYNLLRILSPLVYLAGLILLWAFERASVETIAWFSWPGTFVTAVARMAFAARLFGAAPSYAEGLGLLRTALGFHTTALVVILGSQVDRLVVITLWDNVAVGLYTVAFTVATTVLGVVTQTFHTVLFPRIAASEGAGAGRAMLTRGLRHASLMLALGTLGLMPLVPWLLPALFGTEFSGSVVPALILLIAYLPLALRQISVRCLRGFGEARPGTAAELVSLAGFLTLFWPLGQFFGLVGIGLALFAGNAAALGYLLRHLRRHHALNAADFWGFRAKTLTKVWQDVRHTLQSPKVTGHDAW